MRFSKWTLLRALVLVFSVAFVWCLTNDRLSPQTWSTPVDYFEDTPMVLGWIQAAAEGDFVPFLSKGVRRLGAPYSANWNDWPVWGEELIYFHGLVARCIGLFAAANFAVLFGYITSALGFYAVCRLFRFRWEWSFVGAVLFAFTYFHAYRHLHHLLHTYSYAVPFAILTFWLLAFDRRLRWWDWRCWICLVTAVVMGITNPYNLNMLGQLVCLALIVQLLAWRRKANLQIGIAMLVLMGLAFLTVNLDTFTYRAANGVNPDGLTRMYYETERHALKPLELIVPPLTHNIAALARIASRYMREALFTGEPFSPYLGIVGMIGLVWMVAETLRRTLRPKLFRGRLPSYLPLVSWVMLYSVVGGVNCVIGLAGLPLFRGGNRYSIFISALVLLFLVSRLSIRTRKWSPATRFAVAAAILVVGLYDQLPQRTTREETQAIAAAVDADRKYFQAMEEKLPAGAMVFQLPVVPYPESVPIGGVHSYDLLRPWFFTKSLRLSFGTDKGRQREDWMQAVERMPGAQMASTLEKYGFAGILLNRKGIQENGQTLIKQLKEAGKVQMFDDGRQEHLLVLLSPASSPELPPPGNRTQFQLKSGWVGASGSPSGTQHWTDGDAVMTFFNPPKLYAQSYRLSCQVGSMASRRVHIELNGREVWTGLVEANQLVPLNLQLDAKPGANQIRLTTDVTERPSKANPTPRAFALVNLQIIRLGP